MEKTLINIKTDKVVKKQAQAVAVELGLTLSAIVNALLRELIREKRITFSVPPSPNRRTRAFLQTIKRGAKRSQKSAGPFSYKEAAAYLDRL